MRKSSLNTVYAYKRLRQFQKHLPARRSSQVRTVLQSQLCDEIFLIEKKVTRTLRNTYWHKKAKKKKYFFWLLAKFLRFWPTVRRRPDRIFTVPRLCSAFCGITLVWCIRSCWIPSETITGDLYRTELMHLSPALKEKRPQYQERHDKDILQHDDARPRVARPAKTYLVTLKWEVLLHSPNSPDLALSGCYLFRSMAHSLAHQQLRSNEEVKKHRFFEIVSDNCQRDGKK